MSAPAGSGVAVELPGAQRPAAIGRRVGAYLVDAAIAVVVLLVAAGVFAAIAFATGGAFPLPFAVVAACVAQAGWCVVYTLLQGGGGSVGMRALGLRLVRGEGDRLGFAAALWRNVVWWLGGVIVVGMFSPLFDSSPWHRGWHDRASGATMTDVTGRGPAVPAAPQTSASDGAPETETEAVAFPSVLPAAPILPRGEDAALADWNPAGAQARPIRPAGGAGVISFVPGITDPDRYDAPVPEREVDVPVVDAPAPAATGVPSLGDPLDLTRVPTRLPDDERPVARLVWDDGTHHAVFGRTLFGRNPAPEPGAAVSPVRDETLSLSKTHFELASDPDRSLWVIDRHSTNGVVIRRGAQRQRVAPGERTRVRMGDVLEFGDREVTVEVAS